MLRGAFSASSEKGGSPDTLSLIGSLPGSVKFPLTHLTDPEKVKSVVLKPACTLESFRELWKRPTSRESD